MSGCALVGPRLTQAASRQFFGRNYIGHEAPSKPVRCGKSRPKARAGRTRDVRCPRINSRFFRPRVAVCGHLGRVPLYRPDHDLEFDHHGHVPFDRCSIITVAVACSLMAGSITGGAWLARLAPVLAVGSPARTGLRQFDILQIQPWLAGTECNSIN